MLPIRDNIPKRGTAYVTLILIILNSGVFLVQMSARNSAIDTLQFGFMPAQWLMNSADFEAGLARAYSEPVTDRLGRTFVNRFTGEPLMRTNTAVVDVIREYPATLKIFTSIFLHGGWMHLIGNMLFLWIFGNYIEDRLGPILFLIFYLATGICATLAHAYLDALVNAEAGSAFVPLVGASGAISGVMGAYLVLAPKSRIHAIVLMGYVPITVNLPAWVYMAFYIIIQNLYPATFSVGKGGVAHWAHLGGVVAGVLLILVIPKRPPLPVVDAGIDEQDADIVI